MQILRELNVNQEDLYGHTDINFSVLKWLQFKLPWLKILNFRIMAHGQIQGFWTNEKINKTELKFMKPSKLL